MATLLRRWMKKQCFIEEIWELGVGEWGQSGNSIGNSVPTLLVLGSQLSIYRYNQDSNFGTSQ